jgi:uncharacterized protein (DUF2252 family)
VFAAPDRRLVFDLNDFDETLPGPFEWDVKRFAASLAVAARDVGLDAADRKTLVLRGVGAYRQSMIGFTEKKLLEVWYARLDIEDALEKVGTEVSTEGLSRTRKALAKAHKRDSMQVLKKLTTVVDGRRKIISDPPLVVPIGELAGDWTADQIVDAMKSLLTQYRRTLTADRRHLLHQFALVDVARKVVGVGSVGTRAWILLLEADGSEPLFLQAKEAQRSVLADYCGASKFRNEGQRVVAGQHLMQAASDIFLGWQHVENGLDGGNRDFYIRQLRDMKYSAPIEQMLLPGLVAYAELCGWTLARAHARTGDRFAIAGYLGKSDKFDRALATFAERYADRTEQDHAALAAAVTDGRIEVVTGI